MPAGEAVTSMLVFFSCSTLLLPMVSPMTMDTATCLRTWEYRRPVHSSVKKTHRSGLLERVSRLPLKLSAQIKQPMLAVCMSCMLILKCTDQSRGACWAIHRRTLHSRYSFGRCQSNDATLNLIFASLPDAPPLSTS
ncbi:hypothetical protein F4604DRAFT_1747144 [Suillus subluteus]|nr:hypothetical protein F4604DRAFT_1747144 [Suillus subluteus]